MNTDFYFILHMNFLNVACAIILNNEKVFVAKRSEIMSLPFKWEFPGGKVNDNESEEECIHRELKEELNIKVEIIRKLKSHCHDYGETKITLIPFIVKYYEGQIILNEHSDAGWFSKKELIELDWATADIPVLDDFLKSY
jgi:8-oxo-dGTP diphosphatase